MQERFLRRFINKNVAVGIPVDFRRDPYFYFGRLIQVDSGSILIELDNDRGYKRIKSNEIHDIHLDKRYIEGANRK